MNRRRISIPTAALCVATLVGVSGRAQAGPPQVIYTKIPGSPTSLVPGALDGAGHPATTNFRSIDDFSVSPDGSNWMLRGSTQQGAGLQSILVHGTETTGSGFAQAGQPFPGGSISETYDFLGRGSFNISNQFGFSASTTGLSEPTAGTVYWDGSTFSKRIHTNDLVTGMFDIAGNVSGDELVGATISSAHLLNNGLLGADLESIQNCDQTRERALLYDLTSFQQIGVSTVVTLDNVTKPWFKFDPEPFHTTPDGAHWTAVGKVIRVPNTNKTDTLMTYDGGVVLQQDKEIPGDTLVVSSIDHSDVIPCGTWFARGLDAANRGYAVRQGVVAAEAGGPVPNTPGVVWGSVLIAVSGNCVGQTVIAGKTVGAIAADDVLAITGIGIVVREGDPVDVNGDGLFNDDAFIGRGDTSLPAFAEDQVALTDSGVLYFIASLHNSAGQDLNSSPAFGAPTAFLRLTTDFCHADMNGDGFLTGDDFDIFVRAFVDGAALGDYNGDGFVTGDDFDSFVLDFTIGC